MRPYELMVIFDLDLEESDIRERVERVVGLVKADGGSTGRVDYWGRRAFAYEMKHRSEGYYVLVELLAEPATVAEVDRLLTLEDAVLRHKIMRVPEHAAGRQRANHRRQPVAEASKGAPRADGNGTKAAAQAAEIAAPAPEPGVAEPAAN
ncbi:MAG: 30S ribosomal protein S6 [Acidimicrobiales bacterium]